MLLRLSIVMSLALCPAVAGQSHFPPGDSGAQDGPAAVFRAVEAGIRSGDVRAFSSFFSRTVSLNVRGSSPGYYSGNQAGEVVRHFLQARNASAFRFTAIDSGGHPYATGGIAVPGGTSGERIQVYVGLTRDRAGWLISQFNIY